MPTPSISKVTALEILDSRGNPTVMAKVELSNGMEARAGVPSGASTGRFEALELRDNDINRYRGRGTRKAVDNIKTVIHQALKGKSVDDSSQIDRIMIDLDGTEYKSKLGANAILAVSLACARLAAKVSGKPLYQYIHEHYGFSDQPLRLPEPMMNIMNGGKHSDSGLSIQEFMVVPHAPSFHERVRIGAEIFMALGDLLHQQRLSKLVGDEGGYAPRLDANTKAFEMILEAIHQTNYKPIDDVTLAIDAAATVFYEADLNQYRLMPEDSTYSADKLVDLYKEWTEKYFLRSVEDGLREDDWNGWKMMTKKLGGKAMVVGDDLFVTNPSRLREGIKKNAANAIIIKPNQIGTMTEAIEATKLAQQNHYAVIVAHRSGETIDDFIADLAVGVNADYIKTGSLSRGERMAKYNRLLEIEMELSEWKK
ncbi:MAG: phosphopyruvate hydratase [Candidatus Nomurabacteria bacterium]|nr:MAG: phosphopyruvate hydratase [Candidatus Nomurabacteria bacterium]